MEYFSEVYGNYYRAVAAVLTRASQSPLTEQEISDTVLQAAFGDSSFYITPNLISGKWPLLYKKDGLYYPVTKNQVQLPMTLLERRWLSAVLNDARSSAFFDEDERLEIQKALDCQPLYDCSMLKTVDACADGDPYADPCYRDRLRMIISAVHSGQLLRISFTGGNGSRITGDFKPLRLEYSPKDDKLRLHAVRIRYGKAIFPTTINLGRIEQTAPSAETFIAEIPPEFMHPPTADEPVVIELINRRNALERFMVQFASYDKRTRRVDETDRYICSIFYNPADETELLIRLLSFGVTVKVLSPDSMVEKIRKRIEKQWKLLEEPISSPACDEN